MSIVHIFVCDYCGNQNELPELEREAPEDHMTSKNVAINSNYALSPSPPTKYDADDESNILAQALQPLYYSVSLEMQAEHYWTGNERCKSRRKNFSFCGKSCFVDYVGKYMKENGSFVEAKQKYVEKKV